MITALAFSNKHLLADFFSFLTSLRNSFLSCYSRILELLNYLLHAVMTLLQILVLQQAHIF